MNLFLSISEDYMLPCLNKKFFGIECPGCGMQRSMALLIEGDFAGAFKMYPGIYPLMMLFIFISINIIDKKRDYTRINVILAVISGLTILINYILKFN